MIMVVELMVFGSLEEGQGGGGRGWWYMLIAHGHPLASSCLLYIMCTSGMALGTTQAIWCFPFVSLVR